MQTNVSSYSSKHYNITVDNKNKTYQFYSSSNPPINYDAVVTTLKTFEEVLSKKYQVINCSPQNLLDISRSIYKSRHLFDSIFDFMVKDRALEVHQKINNWLKPPKIFSCLDRDVVKIILSNLLCKNLTSIALLNRDGNQHVNEQIIYRAKAFGYTKKEELWRAQFYLKDLFKNAIKFSKEVLPKKYLCLNGEETLTNIQMLVKENFFIDFHHKSIPILHFSILSYPSIASFFINKDTINQKDTEGQTPLMIASYKGLEGVVKLLLDYNADVSLKDNKGNTSLHFSIKSYFAIKIIKLLVDHNADINSKNNDGNTPLHLAALQVSKVVIKFIESLGPDLNIYNNNGQRAFTLLFDNPEFQPCKLNHFEKSEQGKYEYTYEDSDYGIP